MKHISTTLLGFLLLILITTGAWGQGGGYTFSHESRPYMPLQSPEIAVGLLDTAAWISGDLPFTFRFCGVDYRHIECTNNGTIFFVDTINGEYRPLFALYNDYSGRSLHDSLSFPSRLSLKSEGDSGNRIVTVEWRNLGFRNDTKTAATDSISFQARLFEGSNQIEVHIGPAGADPASFSAIALDSTRSPGGLFCGIGGADPYWIELEGAGNDPHVSSKVDAFAFLVSIPTEGTVYRFTPGTSNSGVEDHPVASKGNISLHPNPVTDRLTVISEYDIFRVEVVSTLGETMIECLPSGNSRDGYTISVASLPAGYYLMRLHTATGVVTKGIVKEN
jgi:hypothetical protein